MASKRLSKEQMDQMRTMVLEGVSPEDMSKHFSIAISSVHNYKTRFKKEGLNFPVVRGKRPVGNVPDLDKELDDLENNVNLMLTKVDSHQLIDDTIPEFKFRLNNKTVEVKGEVVNIVLKKNSIEIFV
jgi:hypothetical protein